MPEVKAPAPQPTKGLTQQQKIVAEMCTAHIKQWWLPSDFMKGGEFFVGYEASARLSELARQYPEMFESRRAGKYMERRIKFEEGRIWWHTIPKDLQAVVKRYYNPIQKVQL